MGRFGYLLLTTATLWTASGCCFLYPDRSCLNCNYGCGGDKYYHDELNPWPEASPCDSCGNWAGGWDAGPAAGLAASDGCQSCGDGGPMMETHHGEVYGGQFPGGEMDFAMEDPIGETWRPNSGVVPEYRNVASGRATYRPGQMTRGRSMRSEPSIFADGGDDLLAGLLPLRRSPAMGRPQGMVMGSGSQMARSMPGRPRGAPQIAYEESMPEAPRMAQAPRQRSSNGPPSIVSQRSRRPASRRPQPSMAHSSEGPRPGAPVAERIDGAPGRVYYAPAEVASEYAGSPGPVYMTEPEWYEGPAREEHRAGLVSSPPAKAPSVAAKPSRRPSSGQRMANGGARPAAQPTRR